MIFDFQQTNNKQTNRKTILEPEGNIKQEAEATENMCKNSWFLNYQPVFESISHTAHVSRKRMKWKQKNSFEKIA